MKKMKVGREEDWGLEVGREEDWLYIGREEDWF